MYQNYERYTTQDKEISNRKQAAIIWLATKCISIISEYTFEQVNNRERKRDSKTY